MRTAKKIFVPLMLLALLLVMLSTSVFATENGSAWLYVATAEGNTTISVMSDAAVTNAYVEVTYDPALSFAGIEVDTNYVSYYSINTDTAGLVKLAWVSAGGFDAAQGLCLMTLTFNGVSEIAPVMLGELNDAVGNALTIADNAEPAPADMTQLQKACLVAMGLKAENYTEDSFAAMQAALAEAQALLQTEDASQEQVDAAVLALNEAMDNLVLAISSGSPELDTAALEKLILKAEGLQKIQYSEESYAAVEAALAEAREVLSAESATQEQVDAAAAVLRNAIDGLVVISAEAPPTGGSSLTLPMTVLLVLSVCGIFAVAAVLLTKKGRCAK